MFTVIRPGYLIILFSTIILIISCGEDEEKEEILRPVRYQKIFTTGGASERTFTGTAKVGIESNLSFKVGGTISEIKLKVGDIVKKGQVLAKLNPTDLSLQEKEAEAALKEAESQLLNAKNNYNRIKQLYENNTASKSDLDKARSSYESSSASTERLKNSLKLARQQLSYTILKAPDDGIIAVSNSEVNENVQAGQTIAILNVGKEMEVSLGLAENVINRVVKGMKVDVSFSSVRSQTFKGTVSEVSPSIDINSSTYPVRIIINNPTKNLKSGMAANVKFSFSNVSTKELLIVPVSAVGEDSKGRFVFLVEPLDSVIGIIKKQHIEIGELTNEGFEVITGLSVGQEVVTAGLQTLLEGQKVKIK